MDEQLKIWRTLSFVVPEARGEAEAQGEAVNYTYTFVLRSECEGGGLHVRVKSPITTQLLLHLYRHLKDSFKQLPKPSMDGAGHPQIHTWAAPSWANFNPLCFSAALGQSLPLVTQSPFSRTAAHLPVPPRPLSASFPATTNVEILPALSSCLSDFNNLCNPRDQMGFA